MSPRADFWCTARNYSQIRASPKCETNFGRCQVNLAGDQTKFSPISLLTNWLMDLNYLARTYLIIARLRFDRDF